MENVKRLMSAIGLGLHPLRLKYLVEYFMSIFFSFESFLISKNIFGAFLALAIMAFAPSLILVILIYAVYATNSQLISEEKIKCREEIQKAVLCIQMNHLHTLEDLLKTNPVLLKMDYKKRSLIYWCRYYRNTKALTLVAHLQKNP